MADVTDGAFVKDLWERVATDVRVVDVLVNNAGFAPNERALIGNAADANNALGVLVSFVLNLLFIQWNLDRFISAQRVEHEPCNDV